MGAAAAAGTSFDELMTLGNALGKSMVSIASTMDHCHVPGRTEHAMLANDEIELGTGPHNEPVWYRYISIERYKCSPKANRDIRRSSQSHHPPISLQ